MRRRDALKALALPALAGLAGCGGDRGRIHVAVVWSGWELTQFHRVLHAFPGRDTWDVSVQSVGDDIGTLLGDRVADVAVPDVALVPYAGLVGANLDRIVPLRTAAATDSPWDRLLTFGHDVYGMWFKVAHKSMVWFREDRLGAAPTRWDWDTWVARCRDLAQRGSPPLAIGVADGWVLTDWFENVLLGLDPQVYRGLAAGRQSWRHPVVRTVLERLGTLWSIPGFFAGGPERVLLTQFDQSVLDVFERDAAAMVVGADFTWPVITQYSAFPPDRIRWFPFPSPQGGPQPVLVGGDAAVLLREGSGGRSLIDWLRSPEAAQIWAAEGGFLSINDRGAGYPPGLNARPLIEQVRKGSGDGGTVTFDLSDQLSGRLAGGEGRGTWKIFKDFFTAVAVERSAVGPAADRAVAALDLAARASAAGAP
jgi:alpha-glucoside transport system substrate-binding protein